MVSTKMWLGLFLLYAMVTTLVLATEGLTLGSGQVTHINELMNVGWGNPGAIFSVIWSILTWNFAFFESGIGIWIKMPLMALSAAIIIPLAFDLFRMIFKPFGA